MSAGIYAVANQKGGVGKTTTTAALGALLAGAGLRVLLVDLDQQASLTIAVGAVASTAWTEAIRQRIRQPRKSTALTPRPQPTAHGFDLLAGDLELGTVEAFELSQPQRREFIIAELLATLAGRYDVILLDCPPALGLLTVNALTAAHAVLIPCSPEYLAVQGVERLLNSVADIQASVNPGLVVDGIIPTLVRHVGRNIPAHYQEQLTALGAVDVPVLPLVPHLVVVPDAAGAGQPLPIYDANSPATRAYHAVAAALWPEVFTNGN